MKLHQNQTCFHPRKQHWPGYCLGSAAVNAEVSRGKAGGLYVDQKLVLTGNVDTMSPDEIRDRLRKILEENKEIINITPDEIKLDELEIED